jgi:hypothetical protein
MSARDGVGSPRPMQTHSSDGIWDLERDEKRSPALSSELPSSTLSQHSASNHIRSVRFGMVEEASNFRQASMTYLLNMALSLKVGDHR